MILSRLRRCFSSQPSTSPPYRRLQTEPPASHPEYGRFQFTSPRPLPISDKDCGRLQTTPPLISDRDCGRVQTTPPPISDRDCELLQTTPPPISDRDFGLLQTTPPPNSDRDCGQLKTTPPPISDQVMNEWQASATYRIKNELKVMNQDCPTHCSFGPVDGDMFRWEGVVIGPAHSSYEGGIFRLSIELPSDYPSNPPKIKFQTKIFHPNVGEDGSIHIDILGENWSPALTIEKLLLSICSILSDPHADSSINEPSSIIFNNDWLSFNQIAREWTKIYAMDHN